MSEPKSAEPWTFVVEALDAPDQLLRVLDPFVVIGAWPAAAALERAAGGVRIRIEADGLDEARAETLRLRLLRLPGAITVGVVWRSAATGQKAA